jgi:hypothetical protein
MSEANIPDSTVKLVCKGRPGMPGHNESAIAVVRCPSAWPELMRFERATEFKDALGRVLKAKLECEECGGTKLIAVDDWRHRIVTAHEGRRGQLDISDDLEPDRSGSL